MTHTLEVNVTNMLVLSAGYNVLTQLAAALVSAGELKQKQADAMHKRDLASQRVQLGTRYANSVKYGAAFAAGTLMLTLDMHHDDLAAAGIKLDADASSDDVRFAYEAEAEAEAEADARASASSAHASAVKSAKAWLHELFNKRDAAGAYASYTLSELCALTGKSEVNVRTMLSDLRSAKYAGKYGVLNTRSVRVNNVTRYSL